MGMDNNHLPSVLPPGWIICHLNEVAEVILGQSPSSSTYNGDGEGFPFYQGKADFGEMYPSPRVWCTEPKKVAEKGDVLISVRAPVGPTNLAPDRSCIGRGLAAVRPLGSIEPIFILYMLRAYEEELASKGTGSTFTAISGDTLRRFPVPIPPLAEQRRIVAKIEIFLSGLKAVSSAVNQAEIVQVNYPKVLLKSAFEGMLSKDCRVKQMDKAPSIKFNSTVSKQQCNKQIAGIKPPDEWNWLTIRDIAVSMKNGIYKPKEYYTEDGIACLRMYNIEDGRVVLKDIKRMSLTQDEMDEYCLKPKDLLINRVNSKELVGKAAIIPDNLEPCVYESKNIRLRLKGELVDSRYVNYWFLFYRQNYFSNNAQQVVGMASINQVQIGNMPIPLPHLIEQRVIADRLDHYLTQGMQISKELQRANENFDIFSNSILGKAFEGKLVPQDPNDEPASILLERIRAERSKGKGKQTSIV